LGKNIKNKMMYAATSPNSGYTPLKRRIAAGRYMKLRAREKANIKVCHIKK